LIWLEVTLINRPAATNRPRIAASSYLNTAPLIWKFARGSGKGDVELVDATPARCAELLTGGEVEAALVPVIEYQRQAELRLVQDVCVGSKKRVRSVVLVSRQGDLKEVRSVALDESSRTSATLVKILYREFLDREPRWVTTSPDIQQMLRENDAALIIGDPAMTFAREGLQVFDLAGLWREHTGLGFVFAMWMARQDASRDTREIDFRAARAEGLEHTQEIIDFYQPQLGWPRNELEAYLYENISFSLDSEMRDGLDLYYQLAQKHDLIKQVRPLKSLHA
jgi:chorismate dehydratase